MRIVVVFLLGLAFVAGAEECDSCSWDEEEWEREQANPYFERYPGCCAPYEPQDVWEKEERFREETSWPGEKDDDFIDELMY